jgi:hypothetical protein
MLHHFQSKFTLVLTSLHKISLSYPFTFSSFTNLLSSAHSSHQKTTSQAVLSIRNTFKKITAAGLPTPSLSWRTQQLLAQLSFQIGVVGWANNLLVIAFHREVSNLFLHLLPKRRWRRTSQLWRLYFWSMSLKRVCWDEILAILVRFAGYWGCRWVEMERRVGGVVALLADNPIDFLTLYVGSNMVFEVPPCSLLHNHELLHTNHSFPAVTILHSENRKLRILMHRYDSHNCQRNNLLE